MDRQSVYTLSVFPQDTSQAGEDSRGHVQEQLVNFILDFHLENAFIYRSVQLCHYVLGVLPDVYLETKYEKTCSPNNTTATSTLPT